MAEIAGYDGDVVFSTVISDNLCANTWTLDLGVDVHDVTDFCTVANWREFISGLRTWTATVDAKIDSLGPINATSLGASATLSLYLSDSGYYSGTAYLNSINPSVSVDAEETYSLGFQGTSTLSFT